MKRLLWAGLVTLIPVQAPAQTADSPQPRPSAAVEGSLATPTGHEVNISLGTYNYTEPGDQSISIHGFEYGGEYTGTLSLSKERFWFAQADVRGSFGNATYDGWCSPWLITPDRTSPNGYALDIGDASPCSESGD